MNSPTDHIPRRSDQGAFLAGSSRTACRFAALGLAFLGATGHLLAADYYVSSTRGTDTTTSGSSATPFATVAYALSRSANDDTLHLERGSVFRESLGTISRRNLRAFGSTGGKPVLSGATRITGTWSSVAGAPEVKYITFGEGAPQYLYVNGALMHLARYPNKNAANGGWLFSDSAAGGNAIVDAALADHPMDGDDYWNGARVRWRRWSWWYETRGITDYAASTQRLTLAADATHTRTDNGPSGFYIENKLEEIDAPGEYFYDAAQSRLYLYPPTGVNLNSTYTVIDAVVRDGFTLGTGVTVDNIHFRHATSRLLALQAPATISNCLFEDAFQGLTMAFSSSPTIVEFCTFRDIYNRGIVVNQTLTAATGTIIRRNTFERIGMEPGLSGSSLQQAIAIDVARGNGVVINRNRFTDIGYAGVNVHQNDATITRRIADSEGIVVSQNVFIRCMSTLNDGSAIRFVSDANTASDNTIIDTIGQMETSQPFTPLGHGIWLEFVGVAGNRDYPLERNKVLRNTVYGSNGHGIFVTNQSLATINNNTFVSNRLAGIDFEMIAAVNPQHTLSNNLFAIGARSWQQPVAPVTPYRLAPWADTQERTISYELRKVNNVVQNMDFASSFTGTTVINRTDGNFVQKRVDGQPRSMLTLPTWYSEESDWADTGTTKILGKAYLFVNDTNANGTVMIPVAPAGYAWTTLAGTPISGNVTLNGHTSTVLLLTGPSEVPASLPGYFLRSQQ